MEYAESGSIATDCIESEASTGIAKFVVQQTKCPCQVNLFKLHVSHVIFVHGNFGIKLFKIKNFQWNLIWVEIT